MSTTTTTATSGFDFTNTFRRFRASYSPRLLLSELLLKQWFEPIIPFTVMIGLLLAFSWIIPGYASATNALSLSRLYAEFGFVALGMAFCLISGGIDLSVGAIFAFCNFATLFCLYVMEWPVWAAVMATLVAGVLVGAVNGVLIGYLKARPFLTTLVTLIILRASVNLLNEKFATVFATNSIESDAWDYLGEGFVFGVPVNAATLILVLLIGHVFLSRSRYGWHITAIGASRKAARHAGIRVERMLLATYALSGFFCAIGGVFYAARQSSTDSTTGVGWEFQALTAVVLGGVSLAGGKGTVWRAMIGGIIVFALTNGLVRMGIPGYVTSAIIGVILLAAVGIDVKWSKNRGKAVQKIYVNPAHVALVSAPSLARGSATPFAQNDRLIDAETIGLDQVEGPEDVILDRHDRLYGSTRDGNIVRFSGEGFQHREVFAHIGGRPLGMQFDKDENLIVAVAGMEFYGIKPDGGVFKVTDETNRTWYKLNDDSRLRMADDLDIGPDGKIYFSDCTTRYEMTTNSLDIIEGRPNGRLVVYDPVTKKTWTEIGHFHFPNGICVAHDGKSVLIASTSLCQVYRYWLEGPKKGEVEVVLDQLPGNCDNINRASDGNYWLALVGIRTPVFDLAMRNPGFRLRMVKQVPIDEWLAPGLNHGCVLKFTDKGEVLESYWDPTGVRHSTLTSMREHKGYLYLGGLENNRIGRIRLPNADPMWTGYEAYWGDKRQGPPDMGAFTHILRDLEQIIFPNRDQHPIPAMDGPFTPNDMLDHCRVIGGPLPGVDAVAGGPDGGLYVSAGAEVHRLDAADYADRRIFATVEGGSAGGIAFHPDGRLLVCVGGRGLAAISPDGRTVWLERVGGRALRCLTDVVAAPDGTIFLSDGSAQVTPDDWLRDLMLKGCSGRLVQCSAALDDARVVADGLAYPSGLALTDDGRMLWYTESWTHRLTRAPVTGSGIGKPVIVMGNMPGYPARLSGSHHGGFWLSLFAVRTHLVEFVLREDDYRAEMMRTIPAPLWIGPALATSGDCLEPMQFGNIKALGIEKPWAPPRSYGLVVRIDPDGEAVRSLHSRRGGVHHGITAALETADGLVIVSKGSGRLLLDTAGTGA